MEPPIRELLKDLYADARHGDRQADRWPTANSGIDLSTLGATLDVRVNGGISHSLREAPDPSGGVARFRAPEADR
jgi:cobalamin biosynthesis protein CobD/CbiB